MQISIKYRLPIITMRELETAIRCLVYFNKVHLTHIYHEYRGHSQIPLVFVPLSLHNWFIYLFPNFIQSRYLNTG